MIPRIPTFPYPVIEDPSVFQIMDLVQGSIYAWSSILKQVGLDDLADEFDGLDSEQKINLDKRMLAIRPEYRAQMQTMAQDIRPYRVWERYRESYEPHPALSQELVKMRSSTKISGDVFQRLRHPNPVFLLPGTPLITFPEGSPGRIIAIFITGAVARRHQRSDDAGRLSSDAPGNASVLLDTHDPEINAYHAMIVSEVFNPEGTQVTDMDWCHITIPVRDEFTLDDLAHVTAADGFNWTIPNGTSTEDNRYGYLLGIAQATVSHLLYACSRTIEVDDKPRATRPPAKRKKGAPRPPASARVRRMGWRVGAAIEDGRRRAAEHRAAGPGTGRTVAPHMRGAHPHLYRVGPGRKEIEIKFLDPIPVNMAQDDGTTITSHPMR